MCYEKTGGVFHSFNPDTTRYGMVHQLTVTGSPSTLAEPDATLQLTLSSEREIEIAGNAVAGEHTVAVRFESQAPHENFVGHDVHQARLAEGIDPNAVAAWMDWRLSDGTSRAAEGSALQSRERH